MMHTSLTVAHVIAAGALRPASSVFIASAAHRDGRLATERLARNYVTHRPNYNCVKDEFLCFQQRVSYVVYSFIHVQ
jgi:hypothetical protein